MDAHAPAKHAWASPHFRSVQFFCTHRFARHTCPAVQASHGSTGGRGPASGTEMRVSPHPAATTAHTASHAHVHRFIPNLRFAPRPLPGGGEGPT
jgi:hypothetical protein